MFKRAKTGVNIQIYERFHSGSKSPASLESLFLHCECLSVQSLLFRPKWNPIEKDIQQSIIMMTSRSGSIS